VFSYSRQLVDNCTINNLFRTDLELDVHAMDNIKNANYSANAPQIYCELSVGTALSTCYRHLTCINISLDNCLLATDRINLLVFISVVVRLQYFVQYSIYVNIYIFFYFDTIKQNGCFS